MSRILASSGSPTVISAPVLVGDGGEQLVVEDVALLEEDLALVVHQLALDLLAARASCGCGANAESWMTLISSFWSLRSFASSIDSICLARSSFSTPLRREDLGADDRALTPGGTRSELSRTSPAFSPKMARSSFSSGESWVSPFGVILPTSTSPGFTSAPMRMMPRLVEVLEGLLTDVRDVAGDLLLAELGVARDALELLDVDRGEDVLLERCARRGGSSPRSCSPATA